MVIVGIVNPAAGRGGAARQWMNVCAHITVPTKTLYTKASGHAIELTRQAIAEGAERIVAVGGDGTINEVVNGFVAEHHWISGTTVLGILSHGTGGDFTKVLDLPEDPRQSAEVIQSGKSRFIDLMKVRYTKPDGAMADRYSINITSFGISGAVASRVNRSAKILGGKVSFLWATLRTAMTFRGTRVSACLDNASRITAKALNVAVGNGRFHGGGMLACPDAAIDDGLLDVTFIESLPLLELVRNLPRLYNGKIYGHPKIRFFRVKGLQAQSEELTLLEIDGEPIGQLPVEITVLPRAIRILAG